MHTLAGLAMIRAATWRITCLLLAEYLVGLHQFNNFVLSFFDEYFCEEFLDSLEEVILVLEDFQSQDGLIFSTCLYYF